MSDTAAEMLAVGSWHLWEPDKPHARALVKVVEVSDGWLTTRGWDCSDGSLGHGPPRDDVNDLDRFLEATAPIPANVAACILGAVAAERERCERIAKERSSRREVSPWSMGWRDCAEAIAAAIRGGDDR